MHLPAAALSALSPVRPSGETSSGENSSRGDLSQGLPSKALEPALLTEGRCLPMATVQNSLKGKQHARGKRTYLRCVAT